MIRVQLREAIEIGRQVYSTLEEPKDGQLREDARGYVLTMSDGRAVLVPWTNIRCVEGAEAYLGLEALDHGSRPDPLDVPIRRDEQQRSFVETPTQQTPKRRKRR